MKRQEIIDAIVNHMINARENRAQCVYFDALATDDDTTTIGQLVDQLPASAPAEPQEDDDPDLAMRNAGNKLYDLLNSKGLVDNETSAALEQWDIVA